MEVFSLLYQVLWIQIWIQIGSKFRNFVDPDPDPYPE